MGSHVDVDDASWRRNAGSTGSTGGSPPAEEQDTFPEVVPRALRTRPSWEVRYARAVAVSDVLAVIASLALRGIWGEGPAWGDLVPVLAVVTIGLVVLCLLMVRAWEPPVLGQGSEEFTRLSRAMAAAAIVLGLSGLALKLPELRPWVFGVIPIAWLFAALSRLGLRKLLHRRRARGQCLHEVLAVGSAASVAQLITRTRRATHHGWVVSAACTPPGMGSGGEARILDVPVVGDLDAVGRIAARGPHRVVSVGQAPGWSSQRLHQLAWDLEGTGAELVVDPGLMEIAGPRLHMRAVDSLPLLRLTEPKWTGGPRVVKAVTDRISAAALLLLLLPVLVVLAIAVCSDGGPVFFRQTRVGRHGREFRMFKFRTMIPDAEKLRASLVNEAHGPLFKVRNDPRITRVGSLMRRYSLDELPQLLNVVAGSMSIVGPRPPLPEEAATYSRDAQRKLMVKPGLTGLWQVSGRSNLSWEESVRLDLRYVENWSLALDALILWRTIGAVVRGTGAY